jgi:hypothetical protein
VTICSCAIVRRVDFNRLFRRTKKLVEDRGGSAALKEDAEELADVAKGRGSLGDKAKAAAEALKDPGAPGEEHPHREPPHRPPPER